MTPIRTLLLLCLGLLAAACSSADAPQEGQAIPVRTVTVATTDLDNILELPGRVEPVRVAEVRARVTGIVQQRLYEEGTDVGQGQPLFRIDPAELRASYAQTQASLERARATAANANAVVARYRPLVAENAISGQEFDAAQAAAREANANVAQIQAQLRAASLQLGYTTVRAPIAGRAGRAAVTEGALVSQPEGTLMTRIEQISPIYVSFSQSATEVLQIRRAIAAGNLDLSPDDAVEVRLVFPDGTEYELPGLIEFLDFSVDEATGTVELRAEFPNPDGLLLSGEFVNARIYAGKKTGVIAIPQRAVSVADSGGTVMIVDKDGKAAVRPVELGELVGDKWIVTSGLKPGDRVIVSNLQKLQPGMPVQIANAPTGQKPAAKAD
ncbi:efflux RND transporter periplasmic adaptor subunit [Qipengyuania flava]|jgi:membrane fusion protein (multidrug efflux system)|uniref:efflux RND transporter periplasmic adaptor subunit n=1 Tax=Qipengyuania flava TaxID=192812 RepID=UPI0007C37692|nr:efflux RND transporter periplasmic adaptor subunit [Qipengyuania flava]KZX52892.1 efflux transporter periplasmic adaptor subunit [Erythrobacter sp. HI00D59]MBO9503725.1 efflux RND transporter periplasmic adaptor subunit [Qipengyuania flava]MBW3167334.1 efflux RND transporter periplasmic adaptor subunit [Qipengyuania flava]MBY5964572.1 efflux RND transporter periplasmic adaptor subunit [Qipengyuania flava]MBY6010896.1 efflux RND transporter periplasmic adaptor subunit [Qipengyuania flava]|tara:strand:- start:750 stop:1898 length:1149 start_codon:yes stop_codon:yes gene_type:complete